jgi:hypothetical protein
MKNQITHISIAQPCTQAWNDMQSHRQGRFCGSCQKSVIDFSAMSNAEVIGILSSSQHVCGRFGADQIGALNYHLAKNQKQPFSWKRLSLAAVFVGFLPFYKAQAQVRTHSQQQVLPVKRPSIPTEFSPTIITGKVIDKASGQSLSGATLSIKNKPGITTTDIDGNFSIAYNTTGDTVLQCTYMGHSQAEIVINKDQYFYTIELIAREIPAASEMTSQSFTATLGAVSVVSVQERSWRDDPFLVDLVHRLFGW